MKATVKEFNQIITDLKKKSYRPVYFLMGEEAYFIDEIASYIEENVLDESEKEFNQSVLYGKDVNAVAIISEAKRYPMMAERQVVIIKEAQEIKDIEKLESYVQQPLTSTLLVICYKYKKIDKRKSFYKALAKGGVVFDSEKLYENQVPEWIDLYLKEKKYKAARKASLLLTEFLGNDLGKIANELEKLMLNVPSTEEITANHIEQYIGISKDFNNFELNDALGRRDVVKANRIINYFDKNPKDNPMVVTLGIVGNFFSKILIYHSLKNKSNRNETAAALKVHPFFLKDYEIAARNYSLPKTVQVISCLREYDLKSKGVGNVSATQGELLKELVYKILH